MHPLTSFDDSHHEQFMAEGYLRLGHLLSLGELAALQQRIDDIMLGRVRYKNMRFQLNPKTPDVRMDRTLGNQEQTLHYRRIDDLEQDPLFLTYIQNPLILHLTRRYIVENVYV
ncbi:MAG: hypothetical protein F4175_18585, partial [Gemmatimonadetes bacterium]|nr:hypothetical protein [Gemmatimonadota bacterium]